MFAASWPQTLKTTVAFCVPFTSPSSPVEKLLAVVVEAAAVAEAAMLALVAVPAVVE